MCSDFIFKLINWQVTGQIIYPYKLIFMTTHKIILNLNKKLTQKINYILSYSKTNFLQALFSRQKKKVPIIIMLLILLTRPKNNAQGRIRTAFPHTRHFNTILAC